MEVGGDGSRLRARRLRDPGMRMRTAARRQKTPTTPIDAPSTVTTRRQLSREENGSGGEYKSPAAVRANPIRSRTELL